MSIVDTDYRERYRGKGDWFKQFIDNEAYLYATKEVEVTLPTGEVVKETVATKRRVFSPELMFDIAIENGIDPARLERFRSIVGQKTSEGRIRMSVGNMLRAVARKNGGLVYNGKLFAADEEFMNKPVREMKKVALAA